MPILLFILCLGAAQSGSGQGVITPQPTDKSASVGRQQSEDGVATFYLERAAQGDPQAQYELAYAYEYGNIQGLAINPDEAVKWYRKAADQGLVAAQRALGVMYGFGKGTAVDNNLAFQLYWAAAERGDAQAQNNLGALYATGQGVPLDYEEALTWYRRAAEQGWSRAQANLGQAYDQGHGVAQDGAEAMKWFRRAAENGDAKGQYVLAYAYHTGTTVSGLAAGIEKDQTQAFKWCVKSAVQGAPSGAYTLAQFYLDGDGVSPDTVEALRWLTIAARRAADADERGGYSDDARARFERERAALAIKLTVAQVAEAEKRVQEWQQTFRP